MDINNYSRKKLVLFILGTNVAIGLYSTLTTTKVDNVPVFHYTRVMSNFAGWVGGLYIPKFLRNSFFGLYSKVYNVKQEDMIKPFDQYESFIQFFTRPVKARTIDVSPRSLVAPADSKVLEIAEVKGNEVLLVKGIKYKLGELLTGNKESVFLEEDISKIKKTDQSKEKTKIYSAIFYLSPGDYHRYHSPTDMTIKNRNHIVGYLYPVKIDYISSTPDVYEQNERVVINGEWAKGIISQVYVGATNVGSMTLAKDEDLLVTDRLAAVGQKRINVKEYKEHIKYKKGEEVGMFKLGSTIVMLIEVPESFKWDIKEGDAVRYGQTIGKY